MFTILSQEQLNKLNQKHGPDFERFLEASNKSIEDQFISWKLKQWLSDCFGVMDQNDEVVEAIHCDLKTFSNVFRRIGSDNFDPATDKNSLQAGNFGSIFTADVMVGKMKVPVNTILLKSSSGIEKEFEVPENLIY